MARPEKISDIEVTPIEFGTLRCDQISAHPTLLKAYAAFMEACQKAGASVDTSYYGGTTFTRPATAREQAEQLNQKQSAWDEGKKQYDIMAAVGRCEYSYLESMARTWAEGEGLEFPPPHEPIGTVEDTIAAIDEAVEA